MIRRWFFMALAVTLALVALATAYWPPALWSLVLIAPLALIGLYDSFQRRHTILRNFPLIGHGRYLMEMLRPEVHQYFIESNTDAFPLDREMRSLAYQRAKNVLETQPFGSQRDFYRTGYSWAGHSLRPTELPTDEPRVLIGGNLCSRPYSASLLNISAMSYGAISPNAIRALNQGAKKGGFAHNTGEGGVSSYHLEHGGDLIWQIGTGYFGCRTSDGGFDEDRFRDQATVDAVRMIELKLSQGAKPGHGGVLPACKVNEEIARTRGVPVHETVVSPPWHSAFRDPVGLLGFLQRLREASGGKPVGVKLAVGRPSELFSICKAMVRTGLTPDFITVDGGEGGTGAAPLEFANSVGMPAHDAWHFVHQSLRGFGLRDRVKLLASGKILTGFHMLRAVALGADACNSARGMMLALGCIQALRCNTNRCPTGVTTQNPALYEGLVVSDKLERVYQYHRRTVEAFLQLVGATGCDGASDVRLEQLFQRAGDLSVLPLSALYPSIEEGCLLDGGSVPDRYRQVWEAASAERF